MKKRIIALLLALVMVVGMLPTVALAADAPIQDEDGYYQLTNEADLKWFRDKVNAGEGTINARLMADVTLTESWTPIGVAADYVTSYDNKPFSGIFDGNEKTISGLNVTETAGNPAALFGMAKNATIKKLVVKGTVSSTAPSGGYMPVYAGGVVGQSDGGVTLEEVASYVDVTMTNSTSNTAMAGGLFGNGYNVTIKNCANYGTLKAEGTGKTNIGGLCGMSEYGAAATIENSMNVGEIIGGNTVGGLLSAMKADSSDRKPNIKNSATVGGIVGSGTEGTIENCLATANTVGADGVEMDVQQTIDAGLVIHHDYMIDLHTDISGKIYDMTMGDLKELDFGSWKDAIYQDEKIATLQEAMELCRQMPECTVHLELKSTMDNDPDFVPRVLEVLQQTEMVEQVILVSFNHALLRQAKQLLPELRVGALVYGELESMLLPPPIIWKDLGLTNGIDDMEAMDAALPESAADEENCSWMTRWMSDKVSMLRANFPGESLNEIYKNLLSQRDLPGYIRSLDFVPEWVSCEYHTAYKNAGFIDKLHEMGIKVSLWTVDTEDSVRSLLRTSADAYITNRPDRVREWMEKEQAATAPTETATAESAPTAEADAGTAAAE